tara:strand:- start:698 stop:1081 length:384 start_codon:yes stop_codon:yes gene_type:complete
MEINIVLGLVLLVSAVTNVMLLRLAMWQSKDLTLVSDNIGDLVEIIESYRNHLKDVYQLDSFYGDETLESLMTHTNAVRAILEEQYGDVIALTTPIEYQTNEEEENEEESTEKEKHVFYAGSRRRDS